jgi:hypothetical protein
MTALNFTHEDDNVITIRAMAHDDYDQYDDRLDFSSAADRRGLDDELTRAIEELGEDEAAQIYDDAYNVAAGINEDYRD